MSIAGPRLRTEAVLRDPADARPRPGARFRLVAHGALYTGGDIAVCAGVSAQEIVTRLRVGDRVSCDDGEIAGMVGHVEDDEAVIRAMQARPTGSRMKPEKGLNCPDTSLGLAPLTAKDEGDIATVIACAIPPGPYGVMIARGDLAAELGFERMAEMQEEILWICEAAGVPVIWATQVLDCLVKSGVPSRGEMTDAAMAARAECVMLNKGPAICKAVALLDRLLVRMEEHVSRKPPTLRALTALVGARAQQVRFEQRPPFPFRQHRAPASLNPQARDDRSCVCLFAPPGDLTKPNSNLSRRTRMDNLLKARSWHRIGVSKSNTITTIVIQAEP